MNDFTKRELEIIWQFLNIAIEDYQEPDSTYKLRDKTQAMIDNYCDHQILIECSNCKTIKCLNCKAMKSDDMATEDKIWTEL